LYYFISLINDFYGYSGFSSLSIAKAIHTTSGPKTKSRHPMDERLKQNV
jgi:hypothetical protein